MLKINGKVDPRHVVDIIYGVTYTDAVVITDNGYKRITYMDDDIRSSYNECEIDATDEEKEALFEPFNAKVVLLKLAKTYSKLFQEVLPSPIFILLVSLSIPISPLNKTGFELAQFVEVSILCLILVLIF